jgi:hypothetical protein
MYRSPLQLGGSNVLLDLLEALWPLLPVVHDNDSLGLLGQELGHLVHLLLTIFDAVDTNVGNARDTGTHSGSGTALAVLDGDNLGRLDAELLAGVEVDLGIWLGGWWVERRGSAVDVLVWEIVVDTNLLDGGNNTGFGAGGDDAHLVALLLSPLHHFWGTWAWLALLGELGGNGTEFTINVRVNFRRLHLEVVNFLELVAHAPEVLADKGLEKLVDRVGVVDVVLLEDFIAELGAGLEGKELRECEGVITVEEDVSDLGEKQ